MDEKISEDEFRSDVMRFVAVANQKFDGLTTDVRTNGYRLDKLENRVAQLGQNHGEKLDELAILVRGVASDLRALFAQFQDVGVMAIKDNGRIADLEKRVDILEAEVQ